ncbi:MAG: family 16 glycosylhydrolase [Granulosicoccaceae bacterium]
MNKRSPWLGLTRTQLVLIGSFLVSPSNTWAAAPSQPGTPFESSINGNTTLAWVASSDDVGVAGYNLYQDNRYLTTVSNATHSLMVDRSTNHTYYVVAFDVPGEGESRRFSARSAEFTLPEQANEEPEPTAASGLTAARTSEATVSLTWTPATDDVAVIGYNVYRNNQYLTTVSNARLDDAQLTAGEQYEYYVVAFDEPRNFSPRSTTAIAPAKPNTQVDPQPQNDTEAPAVVSNITATVVSINEIDLIWDTSSDNIGVDGYNIYRNREYLTTVQANSFTDTAVPISDTVSYQIVAFDVARNFSISSAARVVSPANDRRGFPPLVDFTAEPIAGPPSSDPFGFNLELGLNGAPATPGDPPAAPTNLRIELVSNDWAEINWAPSADDTEVVAYNIYRSDGTVYTVGRGQTDANGGTQNEINKFWRTTSFIDCNYTRFYDRVHNCADTNPEPGDVFSYTVTAIDDEGNESAPSNSITITYHLERNAPVPLYRDFYLNGDDRFASATDLSNTNFFLDQFDMVFAEEFDGSVIDSTKWNTRLTWGDNRIINGEQQYFVSTQAEGTISYDPFNLTGSSLIIESIPTPEDVVDLLPAVCREDDPTGNERCAFLSGALSSHDLFGMTYGYVEGRMRVGSEAGMLSSFYLYHRYRGEGLFSHAPEIDVIEYLGENPFGDEDAFQTYHYDDIMDASIRSAPTMAYEKPEGDLYSDDFHTYGVLWEPQLVIWYIDGREIKRMTGPQVGRQQMNIVLYLVSGSAWAPTPDVTADIYPLQFEVDYIRAYQRGHYVGNGTYPVVAPDPVVVVDPEVDITDPVVVTDPIVITDPVTLPSTEI